MSSSGSQLTFQQALFNYYKLKRQQEEKFNKEKAKLLNNDVLTIHEKRTRLQQLEKKCVACGKKGGIIFRSEKNLLIAKCGNNIKPCTLDIKLQKATYDNINNQIAQLNNNIKNNKILTIKSKYNFLFGYEPEEAVLLQFNKLKAELIEEVKKYQTVYDTYLNIIIEKDSTEQTDQLLVLVNEFKELIKKYEIDNSNLSLKEAVELYLHSILKINKEIRDLRYKFNGIYYNEKSQTNHLIQDVFTLDELVVPIANSENKIISYVT